jgi:FkbM family methyltransferase
MHPVFKKAAYALLDAFSLGKGLTRRINDNLVRFPARWYRYYPADYEKENYSFLKQNLKKGSQVLDIGAHIGLFSVVSSKLTGETGKVFCFEPTPGTFKILVKTLRLNHCTNVTPVQAAVSGEEGHATFYISKENEGNNSNSLVAGAEAGKMLGYDVILETIDSIVQKYSLSPSLVKIDVEGAELDTLKGGVRTFQTYKPILILGLHPAAMQRKGDSLEQIWDLLKTLHYKIDIDGKEMQQEDFCSRELLFDVNCTIA